MEYIDVLNNKGELTGKTKSKEQIHIDGDWHRAVHVWIINSKNEILIQRRAKTKINNPDMWDISVAGHISAGEDSITSALREIEEEIGVVVSKDDLEYLGELTAQAVLNDGTYFNNEYNDVYLIKKDIDLSSMTKQDEELDGLEYITIDKLKQWVREENSELVMHTKEYELLFNSI